VRVVGARPTDVILTDVKRFSMVAALGTAVVFAAYDGWLVSHARAPAEHLFRFYHLVIVMLLTTWVVADAKESGRAEASFDQGWFVLVLFPLYLPYYFLSTRRWRRGILVLSGVLMLFLLPSLAELCALAVS